MIGMSAWKRPKWYERRTVWRRLTCLSVRPDGDRDGEGIHGEADGDADEGERLHDARSVAGAAERGIRRRRRAGGPGASRRQTRQVPRVSART